LATTQHAQPESEELEVSKLDFDRENPRFPQDINALDEHALIERFIRDERLQELVESIGDHGFFAGEPLLVVPNGRRYTVVEGNRRLAALKLLRGDIKVPHGRIAIDKAVADAKFRPKAVQCLIFKSHQHTLRYLGFRHITGIKPWNALQKARYMQKLLEEGPAAQLQPQAGLRHLARETGSTSTYLGQSLVALRLYEVAERKNFFDLKLSPDDIEFSLLTTALSYSNIAEYVGLESRTDITAGTLQVDRLRNLFFWLFVSQQSQRPIVRESRQLKKLAAVVAEPDAVKELMDHGNLDEAFELSKGTANALTESLLLVERRLQKAWTWLPKVRVFEEEHVSTSLTISETASDLHDAILSKRKTKAGRKTARAAKGAN